MLYFGGPVFSIFPDYSVECEGVEGDLEVDLCRSIGAVLRISFTLAIFHFIIAILCLFPGKMAQAVHEGGWGFKFLIVFVMFVACCFIPNDFFKGYMYVSLCTSLIFILFQVVILIDLAYTWNAKWVGQYDGTDNESGSETSWVVLLVIFTVLFFGGGITIIVFLYVGYHGPFEIVCTSITLGAAVLYTAFSVSPWKGENGSILTCSIVFLFTCFFCWSAILSSSDVGKEAEYSTALQIFFGLAIMILALFYVCCYAKNPDAPSSAGGVIEVINKPLIEQEDEKEKLLNKDAPLNSETSSEELPAVTLQTAFFHLVMVFAALYYGMLLTNWGNPTIETSVGYFMPSAGLGFWIKIVSEWLTILLFIWTLIASKICPDRDFSQ